MKIQYKKIIIGSLVLSLFVSPFYGFAAETKVKTLKEKVGFCGRIDTVTDKITNELGKRTEKFTGKKENRFNNLNDRWGNRDEKRSEHRESQDTRIDNRFTALTSKADTDAKKEAVLKFQQAVNTAVDTRRDSVDLAVKTFRDGVNALVNGKFDGIDSRVLVLKNSVNTAIINAKDSCNNGVAGETVRTTLKNSIKSAYDVFKQGKTEVEIRSEIEKLSLARKQAVDEAIAKFKTDMESARAELKLAFGN